MVFSVVILYNKDLFTGVSFLSDSVEFLDVVRAKIGGKKSPTNHMYKFKREFQVDLKKGVPMWIQQWSTITQLT